jgi:hypothetical protein
MKTELIKINKKFNEKIKLEKEYRKKFKKIFYSEKTKHNDKL